MEIILFFIICFLASCIGSISGIGGGVIIKPLLDSTGLLHVSTAHFLSGCSVLSMTTFSLILNRKQPLKLKISAFLAIGGVVGGLVGKNLYSSVTSSFPHDKIGFWQSVALFLINIFVLIYLLKKDKIKTLNCRNPIISLSIGLTLGIISSFLGIGGGPLNITVLYYFYSMNPKETAHNSLFIIFCSQLASILITSVNGNFPTFDYITLFLMCFGGVLGAFVGKKIATKLTSEKMNVMFKWLLVFLLFINIWNMIRFSFFY